MPTKTTMGLQKKQSAHWKTLTPIVIAGLLFFIANSALWVNNVLFNTEKFTNTTTQAILSESSRMSIAREVTETSLADRPIAQRVLSQPATKIIAALLDTSLAEKAITTTVTRLQTAVTTKNPENIEIDLTGLKNIAATLIDVASNTDADFPEPKRELPDKIVLFDSSKVPNIYSYGQFFLLLAPISALLALVLFAYPHIRERKFVKRIALLEGLVLILFGALALSVGPIFRPMALAGVADPDARTVVANVYNAFMATFNAQTAWLLSFGAVLCLIPLVMHAYNYRPKNLFKNERPPKSTRNKKL